MKYYRRVTQDVRSADGKICRFMPACGISAGGMGIEYARTGDRIAKSLATTRRYKPNRLL